MRQSLKTAALAILILGCSGDSLTSPPDTTTPAPPAVASITLSRDTATLVPAATIQLSATLLAANGQTLDRVVTWTSSDETKARVVSGTVTGIAPGSATITAAVEGQSARTQITIAEGGVVSPSGGVIVAAGGVVQLTVPAGAVAQPLMVFVKGATGTPADPELVAGTAFDLSPATTTFGQTVVLGLRYDASALGSEILAGSLRLYVLTGGAWQLVPGSSPDAAARTVSASITRLGTYAILGDLRVALVEVSLPTASLEVGGTTTLSAVTKDAAGRVLSGRSVAWSSSDESVARVDATTGRVTAVSPGGSTITAASEGVSGTMRLTVSAVPVGSVEITPGTASLFAGRSVQLSAITKDAQGRTLAGRPVTWSSSNAGAVAITPAGLVSALGFGTATITATSEGVKATATITVRHDPIVFVHGYGSSGAAWTTMINRLATDGWTDTPLVTWTYDSNQSNTAIAAILQAKVDSLLAATGAAKVDIIAHSMGGLSSRYFAKSLGGSEKIDAFVSLATPNHGTTAANLCGVVSCVEMRPGSPFLTSLNAGDETPGSSRYATWWTACDEAVTPPESVILMGATNTQTACIGHSDMYLDATVYQQVRDWVK